MNRARRTRERLQQQALRLFEERGFDEVTAEQVARAAGVSHMTFFRHFPTKESVVLDDPYDPVIGEAVAGQDIDLPPLERARLGVLAAWGTLDPPAQSATRARLRLAAGHPGLRARAWENNLQKEQAIVAALTDTGVDRLEARATAGAVLGALTAALFDWAERDTDVRLGDCIHSGLAVLGAAEAGAS